MILQVPDRRDQTDFRCALGCIESVCGFFGVRAVIPEIADAIQGTAPPTVEAILRSLGLRLLSGTMTLRDLKHLTASGRPVMCPLSVYGGHWVVVRGVERLTVHYQDPSEGPKTVPSRDWSRMWRDTTRDGVEYRNWGIACSVGE